MRLLLPGLALLLCTLLPARAGVSVSLQEDAFPFLKKSPALVEFIQKTLDVEDVGWAQNMGRSFINPTGDRLLPYGFRAKPKGQSGAYTLLLLIEQNEGGEGVQITLVPVNKSSDGTPAAPAPADAPAN
jgi:hypothetical protein